MFNTTRRFILVFVPMFENVSVKFNENKIATFKGDNARMQLASLPPSTRAGFKGNTHACVCASVRASRTPRPRSRLFTGAESERICVRKYDLVALRSFTNSSDLSGRGERGHAHSALFQLISRCNIVDLCERACTRGQLRNSGNKNSVNPRQTIFARHIEFMSIKDSVHVRPSRIFFWFFYQR